MFMAAIRNFIANGFIENDWSFGEYPTIKLKDATGYKTDLLLRLEEITDSFGKEISVRYWITDKCVSWEEAQEGANRTLMGDCVTDLSCDQFMYSEMTPGVDYESEMIIGGHDLYKELTSYRGKHVWFLIQVEWKGLEG